MNANLFVYLNVFSVALLAFRIFQTTVNSVGLKVDKHVIFVYLSLSICTIEIEVVLSQAQNTVRAFCLIG